MNDKMKISFPSINPIQCRIDEDSEEEKSEAKRNRPRNESSFASTESHLSLESVFESSGIRSRGSSFLERRKLMCPEKSFKVGDFITVQARKLSDPLKKRNNIGFYKKFDVFEPPIGQGAHGVVKRCRKINEKKDYAVKIVNANDKELIFNIIEEDLILSSLCHPNIVRKEYFEIDREKKTAYLVMEMAHGQQLDQYILQVGQVSEFDCRLMSEQICSALKHMHRRGFCHRDVTAMNIMYDHKRGVIKLLDFNVSKFAAKGSMMTDTGNPQFKAPEILEGGGYDLKVDIWSLGVVMYFMISGLLPFESAFVEDMNLSIIQNKPVIPIDKLECSNILKDLLNNMLELDSKKRFNINQVISHQFFSQKQTDKELIKQSIMRSPNILSNRRKSLNSPDVVSIMERNELRMSKSRDLRASDYYTLSKQEKYMSVH